MPIEINGTEIGEISVDGTEIGEVQVDGTTVFTSVGEAIDVFDRSDLGYYIGDTGQATLPQITSGDGYDSDNALWFPSDNPNDASNLSPDNPGYDSSEQDVDLENYFEPGDVAEIYIRPPSWGSGHQFRFAFFADGYYPSSHIRLRFTSGYWRIEQGSSLYGGTGDAEDSTGLDSGDWHRVVVDASSFPLIECHLWNADTGSYLTGIEGDGAGDPDDSGHQFWVNDTTEMYISDYRLISEGDYDAGSPL